MAAKSAEGQYRQDAELYFIIRGGSFFFVRLSLLAGNGKSGFVGEIL